MCVIWLSHCLIRFGDVLDAVRNIFGNSLQIVASGAAILTSLAAALKVPEAAVPFLRLVAVYGVADGFINIVSQIRDIIDISDEIWNDIMDIIEPNTDEECECICPD